MHDGSGGIRSFIGCEYRVAAIVVRVHTWLLHHFQTGRRGQLEFRRREIIASRPSFGPSRDILQKMQDRLDHAKTSKERDSICLETAAQLADQGDPRAKDVADKIDDSEMRNKVRSYVDFQMVRFAFKKKDVTEGIRLAKAGQ